MNFEKDSLKNDFDVKKFVSCYFTKSFVHQAAVMRTLYGASKNILKFITIV
jgi:hypothetical protein